MPIKGAQHVVHIGRVRRTACNGSREPQADLRRTANYSYYIGPVSDPSSLESGSFITTTDLGGNFVNYTQLSDPNETPGTLQIAIPFSEPGFPHNILALWNGSTFTIQQ
jgi:hypothetical protein